jgi:hypothetical protein
VKTAPSRNWREQYDRMLRWLERLHEPGEVDERRCDDFYAFFLICYHLKDWIKSDPWTRQEVPEITAQVEKFVNDHESLRVCADIANGVKHLVRDNPKTVRVDPDASLSVAQPAFESDAFEEGMFHHDG